MLKSGPEKTRKIQKKGLKAYNFTKKDTATVILL